jgi:hypothetical protein
MPQWSGPTPSLYIYAHIRKSPTQPNAAVLLFMLLTSVIFRKTAQLVTGQDIMSSHYIEMI